jgi:hypothetical protein
MADAIFMFACLKKIPAIFEPFKFAAKLNFFEGHKFMEMPCQKLFQRVRNRNSVVCGQSRKTFFAVKQCR